MKCLATNYMFEHVRVLILNSNLILLGHFDIIVEDENFMGLISELSKKYAIESIEYDTSGIIIVECVKC